MRWWCWALGPLAAVVACGGGGDAGRVEHVPDDPVATVRALIAIAKRGHCEAAWGLLSEATRQSLQARARLEIRQAPYSVEAFSPAGLLCQHTVLAACEPESPRVEEVDGERAVVVVTRLEARDFRIPGFSPRSHEPLPATLQLVREGRWRLELVMQPPADLSWKEERVNGVAVRFHSFKGNTTAWVEGPVDASPKKIQAVVADAAGWGRLLPWITDVAVLPAPEASDDGVPFYAREDRHDRHLRLRIASPGGPPVAAVVRVRPYADAHSSSCCFGAGGSLLEGNDATPLGIGDLTIVAYPDGDGRTLMQLGYRVEAARAPAVIADRMLAADAVAALFGAIGRAARGR